MYKIITTLLLLLVNGYVNGQCAAPINLSVTNITDSTASLFWTETGAASGWEVELVAEGNSPIGSGLQLNTTIYNTTGLMPGSNYSFYVRSDCGSLGFSNWVGPFNFSTVSCDFSIVSYENPNTCLEYCFYPTNNIFGTFFDFNSNTLPLGWDASPFTVGSPCVANMIDDSPYFWAGNIDINGNRHLTTSALDVTQGGDILFYMRYGSDDPISGCESPNSDEGVYLQYSIDNGVNWVDMNYWNSLGILTDYLYVWNQYIVSIPLIAQTANTKFRWLQPTNSGTEFDNWGLDNILVSANVDADYLWDFGDGNTSTIQTPCHTYSSIGDYVVTLSVVTEICDASESVTFNVSNTDLPIVNCQDVTVNLNSNGEAIITPNDIDNGSTDNCEINTMSLSKTTFDCSNLGNNSVTLIVTDIFGNEASCEANVNVVADKNPGDDNTIAIEFCEGEIALQDLFGAINGVPDEGGDWIDVNNSEVNLSDPLNVNFSNVPAGLYYFQYSFYANSTCPTIYSTITVNIISGSSAGTDGTLQVCEYENNLQSLFLALNGNPTPGGQWIDVNNTGVILSDANQVDFSNIPIGDYQFNYIQQPINGCFPISDSATVYLTISPSPSFNSVDDFIYCDDDNDGFGLFDLASIANDIGGNDPDILIKFYETLTQLENGVGELSNTYYNINPYTQIVYAQITMNGLMCETVVGVNLLVIENPILPSQEIVYSLCDYYDVVDDGIVAFDLPSYEISVLLANIAIGTIPEDYTITYYAAIDALGIPVPTSIITTSNFYENTSATDQIIYTSVVHNATGCESVKEIRLHVDLLPAALYTQIRVCDDDIADGVYTFNLLDYIPEITNGATNVEVIFYLNQADADANTGINTVPNPTAYQNMSNPQPLYARVYNPDTGCYKLALVVLHVNPNPTPLNNQEIIDTLGNGGVMEECDGDVDGSGAISEQVAEFDLTQWEVSILNGESGVSAAYYTSVDDAATGTNPIENPATYTNIVNPQTIYVSVINDGFGINPITNGTGCYTIVEFQLFVPVPEVDVVADKNVICVDENGVPLTNTTLPVLTATVGPAAAAAYNYQWALNGVAIAGSTNQTLSVTLPGDYTVTISGPTDLDCINVSQAITIEVSGVPQGFDANVTTNAFSDSHEIVATATSTIPGIVFWYSLDGAEPTMDGTFTNVSPGIHIVTISDGENCWSTDETVTIIDYPHFFTPNGDGINDTWTIISQEEIPISQIYIFDRFGKLLSQLDPDGEGWDGTYNGSQMPASDYWFKIIYVEGVNSTQKEFKAHFSLKR